MTASTTYSDGETSVLITTLADGTLQVALRDERAILRVWSAPLEQVWT